MGNNSVPKFIFRLSRFPVYRGSVLGRFYCTCYSSQIFTETWIFSTEFSKNIQISSLIKIHPVAVELFHADRRTDMIKLIVAFCDFANAPNYIIRRNSTRSYLSLITVYWAYSSDTTVTPHTLGYDNSIINFVHSIIFQKPQLISYEHLRTCGFVPSINN